MKKLIASLIGTAAIAAVFAAPAAAEKFITIGTGGQTGVYFQVGGAICKLVNRGTKTHDIKCTHTTGGSTKNINGIRAGDLDMVLPNPTGNIMPTTAPHRNSSRMAPSRNCGRCFRFTRNRSRWSPARTPALPRLKI